MTKINLISKVVEKRININEGNSFFYEIEKLDLNKYENIILTGFGSSWNICLVAKYMIEEYTDITVQTINSANFIDRTPLFPKNTLFIAISQSGETMHTINATKLAKKTGLKTVSFVNRIKTRLSNISNFTIYVDAESKPSSIPLKDFISQLITFALFTLKLGRYSTISLIEGREILGDILSLQEKIQTIFSKKLPFDKISTSISNSTNIAILGNRYNYPIAKEASQIFINLTRINTSTMYASEMKHGPLLLVDENMPIILFLNEISLLDKTLSNIQELYARRAKIILISNLSIPNSLMKVCDFIIRIPKSSELLSPILSIIPIEIIAYNLYKKKLTT